MESTQSHLGEKDTKAESPFPETLRELLARTALLDWVHRKSNIGLDQSVAGKTDLDIVVHPKHETQFKNALQDAGFVPFKPTIWSDYHGVSNWLGADPCSGLHFHVHLHNRLLTGLKCAKEQDLPWMGLAIQERTTDSKTGIPIVPAALEAHVLLAREISKSTFFWRTLCRLRSCSPVSKAMREEMSFLMEGSQAREIDRYGEMLWGTENWRKVARHFSKEIWGTGAGFGSLFTKLDPVLKQWRHSVFMAHFKRLWFMAVKKVLSAGQRVVPTIPLRMQMFS